MFLSSAIDSYLRLDTFEKVLRAIAIVFIVVAIVCICVVGVIWLVNIIKAALKRRRENPKEKSTKTPLFRIVKNNELKFWQKLLIRIGIFLLGFVLYMIIISLIMEQVEDKFYQHYSKVILVLQLVFGLY